MTNLIDRFLKRSFFIFALKVILVLFNSFDFGLFLPIIFIAYWLIGPKRIKAQNILLLIASYFFYGMWDWRFLILIFLSAIVDFYSGRAIVKTEEKSLKKRWLFISIVWNLGVLFVFKYFNFFLDNLKILFDIPETGFTTLNIIVPVGLSFYTFQTMSYTIDVYRNTIKPTNNLLNFLCFVSFFPQLVAGPIERASRLLPQFSCHRQFDSTKAKDGLRQILWGLFKKIVVADNLGVAVAAIYGSPEDYSAITIVFGAILFWFQLYCDFSGYADIAIGTARLFGFNLSVNFKLPYLASTTTDFWRRWHITLSKWFQDYVFVPIVRWCSNKKIPKSKAKLIAIFSTLTLIGFWHGANWTFILFGILHGFFMIFEALPLLKISKYKNIQILLDSNPIPAKFYSFSVIVISVIFFRSIDVAAAWNMINSVFNSTVPFYVVDIIIGKRMLALVFLIIVELYRRNKLHGLENLEKILSRPLRWASYYVLIILIIRYGGPQEQFIYFQF